MYWYWLMYWSRCISNNAFVYTNYFCNLYNKKYIYTREFFHSANYNIYIDIILIRLYHVVCPTMPYSEGIILIL